MYLILDKKLVRYFYHRNRDRVRTRRHLFKFLPSTEGISVLFIWNIMCLQCWFGKKGEETYFDIFFDLMWKVISSERTRYSITSNIFWWIFVAYIVCNYRSYWWVVNDLNRLIYEICTVNFKLNLNWQWNKNSVSKMFRWTKKQYTCRY